MSQILIYKSSAIQTPPVYDEKVKLKVWRPSLLSMLPKGKGYKYFLYSIFHFLRVFKNKKYAHVQLMLKANGISGLLVVPAYYKWPFMASKDVQFTYVITDPQYRGKGYAWQMIYMIYEMLKSKGQDTNYWYVTDTENTASIRLAEKMGFTLAGQGVKERVFGLKILTRLVLKDETDKV